VPAHPAIDTATTTDSRTRRTNGHRLMSPRVIGRRDAALQARRRKDPGVLP
jgi:hypothetical protein